MREYYPLLVEKCIEFKRFSRKYLARLKSNKKTPGTPYIEKTSARQAALADGYRFEEKDDVVYVLRDG